MSGSRVRRSSWLPAEGRCAVCDTRCTELGKLYQLEHGVCPQCGELLLERWRVWYGASRARVIGLLAVDVERRKRKL